MSANKKFLMGFLSFLFFCILFSSNSKAANMSTYCNTPPFVTQQVKPNVMLIFDTSSSMNHLAYKEVWDCRSWYGSTSTAWTGYDPDTTYYGYFDSSSRYIYNETQKYFEKSDSGEWCGNFLNWVTMRRVDVAKKVLTGGRVNIESGNYILVEQPFITGCVCGWGSDDIRKTYDGSAFPYVTPKNAAPVYLWIEAAEFTVNGMLTARFYLYTYDGRDDTGCIDVDEGSEKGPYYLRVKLDEKPKGVIQNMGSKVRFGMQKYNNFDGGKILSPAGDSIDNIVNNINEQDLLNHDNPSADTWTPLGENLHTAAGYFAQDNTISSTGPMYHSSDYQVNNDWDPYYFSEEGGKVWCAKSFVILISDGETTEDTSLPSNLKNYISTHGGGGASGYLDDVAFWAHTNDLRNDLQKMQNITFYAVFAFGAGSDLLESAAKFGGFIDSNSNDEPDLQSEWYKDGDDKPDNYFVAEDGAKLETALEKAITDILRRVSSGTAASILASSEKSGANIMQAVFYPKQYFDSGTEAEWIGKLQNLWFYLGPFTQNIREDSDTNAVFNLSQDKVAEFFFDNTTGQTMVNICTDTNGNGRIDNNTSPPETDTCLIKRLEEITPIWEAGEVLWETNADSREILTWLDNSTYDIVGFTLGNADDLKDYLDANSTEAPDIINYIRGEHISGKRDRRVKMTEGGPKKVWKLGDIVYSTPRVVSSVPLNSYLEDYYDNTYRDFTSTTNYKNRGMVFVGANDGMLHAFRFGKLEFPETGSNIAKLIAPLEGVLGSEAWGFIPRNILPYLKYYKETNYCHLAYVDLSPYAFDASICKPSEHENNYAEQTKQIKEGDDYDTNWRTVLIGGLNFGGACGGNNTGAVTPPSLSSPATGVGMSSYFAMDVTNPESPQVLWEFTDNNTAFTTTGPAIIHIPAKYTSGPNMGKDDNSKNGYWYAAFASGPDNYTGEVHQPLYLYVLDLKTGTQEKKIQLSGSGGSPLGDIGNAFAGRFFESQTDLGMNYSDDVLYFGYNYEGSSWHGGILRLVTGNDHDVDSWEVSKLIGGGDIGPVTSGVTRLEDTGNHKLWVYFGEGRYFTADDDSDANRTIYGVKDPCYGDILKGGADATSCTSSENKTNLIDVTNINEVPQNPPTHGWYINLDPSGGGYGAERVITDPVATVNGWVFYTTFMPTSDICGFGGNTYIWMVDYETGGAPQNVGGTIFIQTSTGVIKKIELSKEFGTDKGTHGGRRLTTPIAGAPSPSSGITVIKPPKPIKSLIQWRETPVRKGK